MERCDLQLRQIESFAEHIYANDDARLSAQDLASCFLSLQLGMNPGVKLDGVELRIPLVNLENLLRSLDAADPRHEDVTLVEIRTQLFDRFCSDRTVHF